MNLELQDLSLLLFPSFAIAVVATLFLVF